MNEILTYAAIALALPTLMVMVWARQNKGRFSDVRNLHFKRSKCVKVNFHTATGRNIERFIIPDGHGFMKINGGVYKFHKEFAETNDRYRIPEVDVLESQITPPSGSLGMVSAETEVEIAQPDGTVAVIKKEVPTYFLSYRRSVPERVNKLWAQEVASFADSNIVHDITTSTARMLMRIEWTFYLALAAVAIGMLLLIVTGAGFNNLGTRLDGLMGALLRG